MTHFEEEVKQLSNLSDKYMHTIIDEYFLYANFDDVLGSSFEDAHDNSQYIDSILRIYHQLKKFEPISLNYMEKKVFDALCQEFSTIVVAEETGRNYFDEEYLVEGQENLGFKIFNLFQFLTGFTARDFTWNVRYDIAAENFGIQNFKMLLHNDGIDERDALLKVQSEILTLRNKIEDKLKPIIRAAISFEDWKILYPEYISYYEDWEELVDKNRAFESHLSLRDLV